MLEVPVRPSNGARMHLPSGAWEPGTLPAGTVGLWLVDGLMKREIGLKRTVAVELLGPMDLVLPGGGTEELLGAGVRFAALTTVDIVPLDADAIARLAARPELLTELLEHTAAQCGRAAVHRAITHLPRVEDRLLAILWLLGDRWGRMTPDGVVVPLRLGHEVLGHLIGARRPTVSLAVKALREAGKVSRLEDGTWMLDPRSAEELVSRVDTPVVRASMLQPLRTAAA